MEQSKNIDTLETYQAPGIQGAVARGDQGEEIIAFYDTELLPIPKTSREG